MDQQARKNNFADKSLTSGISPAKRYYRRSILL